MKVYLLEDFIYLKGEFEMNIKRIKNFITGFFLGSLAGGITMLLLAPRSGKATRDQIQEKVFELRDQTVSTVDDAMQGVRTKANQIKKEISNKAKDLKQEGQDMLGAELGQLSDAAKKAQMELTH
jgi:gas vesicle protein